MREKCDRIQQCAGLLALSESRLHARRRNIIAGLSVPSQVFSRGSDLITLMPAVPVCSLARDGRKVMVSACEAVRAMICSGMHAGP